MTLNAYTEATDMEEGRAALGSVELKCLGMVWRIMRGKIISSSMCSHFTGQVINLRRNGQA